jgi:hypothetical protein
VAAAEEAGKVMAAAPIDGDLESHTKVELLDLAAALDIEGRTAMTKAELISAIEKEGRS